MATDDDKTASRVRDLELSQAVMRERFDGHERLCAERYGVINKKITWIMWLLAAMVFIIFIGDGTLMQVIARLFPAAMR